MTETVNDSAVSEEAVIAFLRQQPDFFEQHPNLLKQLQLRHESGNAISLMERQNHILRQENRQLIDRLNHFIEVAQRNDRLFQQLQRLVLAMVPHTTANDLIDALETGLIEHFDVHETSVILCDRPNADGDPWLQISRDSLSQYFPTLINEGKAMCGSFGDRERDFLFAGRQVASLALAPLTDADHQPIGVLALGHQDSQHFRSGTETLFLSHLAQLTSLLLARC
ncbi:hypothetical protein BGP77_12915 [Saccharospirillum sp. MSK14-1]|uniref:DUF484 family protein n=1 Tax=Saccharospirillum sp. MSK14-1 TaxID=1897632 RepID=UPI000D3971DE|nr:DUF484 family protein [Saccharospirillum sp. MSK14-1]PTY37405.1 hypothetical protein BGP77_12915 [Saccharospirillum sp. MSK14-1]